MKVGKNANLQQAKRSKYDEFYTSAIDGKPKYVRIVVPKRMQA